MTVPMWDDAGALGAAMAAGAFSARELTESCLARIATHNPAVNAFTHVHAEQARAQADESDRRRAQGGTRGPLDGIPVAVKDNIAVAGMPFTAGMAARRDTIAGEDAVCAAKLRQAGCVFLGTLNMEEAALGATTDNPHYGATHNPHRHDYSPAGSSGGSGAAVASGLCAGALGTDTLGSVRLPAAYCGVAGLKPGPGRVSPRGLVPLSFRFDHVGPLARSVRDLGLFLDALAGFDPEWADSRATPQAGFDPGDSPGIGGMTLGVLDGFAGIAVDADVEVAFSSALDILIARGAGLRTVTLGGIEVGQMRRAGLLITVVEGAFVHAGRLKDNGSLSPQAASMLEFGRSVASAKLIETERRIDTLRVVLRQAFEGLDAIVTPAAPQAAFAFSEGAPDNQADFTALANLYGAPAVSVPMGMTPDRLPLGLQVLTPAGEDARALRIARAFEREAGLDMRPEALL